VKRITKDVLCKPFVICIFDLKHAQLKIKKILGFDSINEKEVLSFCFDAVKLETGKRFRGFERERSFLCYRMKKSNCKQFTSCLECGMC
jgi:hypothetical protein